MGKRQDAIYKFLVAVELDRPLGWLCEVLARRIDRHMERHPRWYRRDR